MERTETDTRQRLNNKIEQLEAELASMKTRLDQEVAQRHNLGRTMDVCNIYLFNACVFLSASLFCWTLYVILSHYCIPLSPPTPH